MSSALFFTVFLTFSYFHFKCYALSHFLRLIQENVCSITYESESKMLNCPCICHEGIQKVEIWLHTFLTSALNGGWVVSFMPWPLFSIGKAQYKSITFIKIFFVKIMIFWDVMPCAVVYTVTSTSENIKPLSYFGTVIPVYQTIRRYIPVPHCFNVNLCEDLNSYISCLNRLFLVTFILCVFGNNFWSSGCLRNGVLV